MNGEQRRIKIINLLHTTTKPIKGSTIAEILGVSRQVIVQDIALLRASNKNILSTNKGYLLFQPKLASNKVRRTLKVHHTDLQIKDEFYTIVDLGGTVLDVVIEHELYGQIMVDLLIKNRADVDEFVLKLNIASDKPLKAITNNHHFHTIEADSDNTLDVIECILNQKGYLY